MNKEEYYDESKAFLPKKCTECGWSYYHPMTECYADYSFDCSACKAKGTLVTCGKRVQYEPRQIVLKRVHEDHINE